MHSNLNHKAAWADSISVLLTLCCCCLPWLSGYSDSSATMDSKRDSHHAGNLYCVVVVSKSPLKPISHRVPQYFVWILHMYIYCRMSWIVYQSLWQRGKIAMEKEHMSSPPPCASQLQNMQFCLAELLGWSEKIFSNFFYNPSPKKSGNYLICTLSSSSKIVINRKYNY